MTGFDYLVFMVVGFTAIAGFFRGFVEEVLALAAWCVAMLAVHYGHAWLTGLLSGPLHGETSAGVVAFFLLLAVPYFATKLAARQLGSVSRSSALGPIDRVLGFGFGAVKGFIIMTLAFSLLVFAYDVVWGPKGRPAWIKDGRTYPFLNAASEELMTMIGHRRSEAVRVTRGKAVDAAIDAASGDDDATTIQPVHTAPHRPHRHPTSGTDGE
jgi:membrane protein required for colicin V production